jgi:membrane protein DedA with SNARE-associated domain
MEQTLSALAELPPLLVYLVLGVGAALENIVPPIPADTFVLVGGFLSGRSPELSAWSVFFATWGANVLSAIAVYHLGYKHGPSFFAQGFGRHVLTAKQLERMRGFYDRWGTYAIFFTRFLPGLRAVVPAFAGISHQPFLPVALPILVASGIWYGGLVWLGATTARNLDAIVEWVGGTNRLLLGVTLAITISLVVVWYRTRKAA